MRQRGLRPCWRGDILPAVHRPKGAPPCPVFTASPGISGPCGCGKSTLARELAARLAQRGANGQVYLVQGDAFHRGFVEAAAPDSAPLLAWPEILRFNWRCILDTADKALSAGLDVIVDYVVEDEWPLLQALGARYGAALHRVVLTASEEAIRLRLADRGDPQLTDRALFLRQKLSAMPENQPYLLDNTHLSPAETAERLLSGTLPAAE